MAVAMSIVFAVPVYYCCKVHGSFFILWLVWLISLADGIGANRTLHNLVCSSRGYHTSKIPSSYVISPMGSVDLHSSS